MSMDFFLDRAKQTQLRNKLSTIPSLVEDLAITVTRQARVQRREMGLRRQKPESRLPFHIAAAEAADELHNSLVTWTRFVCEERQINYNGHDDDLSLSAWLQRNMVSLALTQGSEEAYEDLSTKIDECRKVVDLPPDDEIMIDRGRVREANRQVLTADQVERIAGRLGPLGVGLNKRRVQTLAAGKRLIPCSRDGDTAFYRLGDVLDAHHRPPEQRGRKRKRPVVPTNYQAS